MGASLVLTLNAGSSSLKVALFEAAEPPARVEAFSLDRLEPGADAAAGALGEALGRLERHGGLGRVLCAGHRVVHGGPDLDGPRRVTPELLATLEALAPLDPDHMPAGLAVIRAMTARAPGLPQAASFDTAFHRTMPRVARLLALPWQLEGRGVRRYGFHGLSYAYLAGELERVAGRDGARGRVVMAHLGSGSSLAALRDGRSVETTMGFTPTSGVPMGTRTGDLDPGALLYLLRHEKMHADAVDDLVNHRAGLLGVSGTTGDMRDLLAREPNDPRAADAIALYVHRVKQAVGALAATLGGVETLVFSGGIGERSAAVRARVAEGLEHLGVSLDRARNERGEAVISTDDARCAVRVIATDEEQVIARETLQTLALHPTGARP